MSRMLTEDMVLETLLRIEALIEETQQPPVPCAGAWTTPVDLITTGALLQSTGRCGICGKTVELMHVPLGALCAVHPYTPTAKL